MSRGQSVFPLGMGIPDYRHTFFISLGNCFYMGMTIFTSLVAARMYPATHAIIPAMGSPGAFLAVLVPMGSVQPIPCVRMVPSGISRILGSTRAVFSVFLAVLMAMSGVWRIPCSPGDTERCLSQSLQSW